LVLASKNKLDKLLGLEAYITETSGIGGVIRKNIEDFIVKEITLDGKVCSHETKINDIAGEYTCFILEKRGIDTLTAFRIIARYFRVSSKSFSAAGLKDAKAITFQIACTDSISPDELRKFKDEGNKVFIHDIFTLPFKVKPGMLYGNLFEITIRNLKVDNSEFVRKSIEKIYEEILDSGGVPNYYGYQRFGTIRPNTHIVGKYILSKKFEEAVKEILLRVYPYESPKSKEARRFLAETWNLEKALELFPKRLHHERKLLYYLIKHKDDYIGALRSLPIQVRRLYIGAYQAYLFNKVLSRRLLKEFLPKDVLPGDIVILLENKESIKIKGVLRVSEGMTNEIGKLVETGKACIAHNVFGYKSIISHGIPGEIELEVLEEEGISIDDFKLKHMPEVASQGSLRAISFYPINFEYRLLYPEDDVLAIFTKFILKKGIYATVFLRELMKPENIVEAGF